ncbi:putative nb-arc domain-containing protein [Phaeoacremonium minimum UCRPA7]|uniref:Putative nb-arc domain-containing protein n=1 Tax=Phaeoacremonium minimum (strain UCR-PA7) TaxID=1286976 RepID=R8BUY1_PHAM7|nr:putative nb-arc domain-containing protein [Phaeoacremonium minimum UCRPA7]EOO03104.1 putative nb-arc domain-containing protein [Phaeoacremonium minimum UCRPA7]
MLLYPVPQEQTDCQKAAIVGLGGIGKTQVALQLAYWVKEHRPEYDIFWVPALSTATFEEAYVEIARRLALQKYSDDDDPKDLVRDHLSSDEAGRWLLIIDNADDGDVLFTQNGLSRYLPESENGLTLFTTRSREVAVETVGCDVVDLSEMDWAEATSFLEKSLIRKDLIHDTAVKELLEEMNHLPLGIAQAAAYLNKNQISITEYLRLLRSAEENMISLLSREFRDMTRYADSQNSVAATWLVSFEQILKSDPFAGDLLSFISCIEPKAIPLWILPKAQVEEHTTRAIGLLCGR